MSENITELKLLNWQKVLMLVSDQTYCMEVGRKLDLGIHTAFVNISMLHNNGLLTKKIHGRQKRLFLTKKGREVKDCLLKLTELVEIKNGTEI